MDKLVKAINSTKEYTISATTTTQMMKKIISNQGLVSGFGNKLSDLVTTNVLMTATLKGENDSISVVLESDGMLSRIISNGNNKGEFSGYAILNSDPADRIIGDNGTLNVVKYNREKEISNSTIKIDSKDVSNIVADYYVQSEQINSVVALASLSDKKTNEVYATGGLLIQVLPNVSESTLVDLESKLALLTELSKDIALGKSAEDLIKLVDDKAEIVESKEILFKCECSKKSMASSLKLLDINELETILEEDKKIQTICNFCNTAYIFNSLNEIEENSEDGM